MIDPTYQTPPGTHPAALDFRRRCIAARIAALDEALGNREPGTQRERALDAELRALRGIRSEIQRVLGGVARRPKLPKDPEQLRRLRILKGEIRARTEQTEWFAAKMEAEGSHDQARRHRQTIPFIAETACRELAIDPALLAFVDPPEAAPIEPGRRELLPHAVGVSNHE